MGAIYKKELKSLFTSIIGYLLIAFLFLFVSIYAMAYNFASGLPYFEYALGSTAFTLTIFIPLLTMRLISDEKKQKTDLLLYSLPLSMTEIVLGKYLATVTFFAVPVGAMCIIPLVMNLYGEINFLNTFGAILAYFLLGCACIAICLFLSSMTENQVVAAALGFAALLMLYFMPTLANIVATDAKTTLIAFSVIVVIIAAVVYIMTKNLIMSLTVGLVLEVPLLIVFFTNRPVLEGGFQSLMNSLSVFSHLDRFISGMFDLTAIFYWLSIAALFIFFTVQSMEKRRWS